MRFLLYCKSYAGDLQRVVRLAQSVARHNRDGIPFHVSCPQADLERFAEALEGLPASLLTDEEIVAANPRVAPGIQHEWEGRTAQQVIKSEFWRAVPCDAYLCIDSDSFFVRDFGLEDFVHPDGTPYTVIHQSKDFLQTALNLGKPKVVNNYEKDARAVQEIFGRAGPMYDFGPTPAIWSARVWEALDREYLEPRGMTLWDAIRQFPAELRWYGEAMLRFRPIALHPIDPLFRVYHYDWQWQHLSASGETEEGLSRLWLGVVMQSNWYMRPKKTLRTRLRKWFRR